MCHVHEKTSGEIRLKCWGMWVSASGAHMVPSSNFANLSNEVADKVPARCKKSSGDDLEHLATLNTQL